MKSLTKGFPAVEGPGNEGTRTHHALTSYHTAAARSGLWAPSTSQVQFPSTLGSSTVVAPGRAQKLQKWTKEVSGQEWKPASVPTGRISVSPPLELFCSEEKSREVANGLAPGCSEWASEFESSQPIPVRCGLTVPHASCSWPLPLRWLHIHLPSPLSSPPTKPPAAKLECTAWQSTPLCARRPCPCPHPPAGRVDGSVWPGRTCSHPSGTLGNFPEFKSFLVAALGYCWVMKWCN